MMIKKGQIPSQRKKSRVAIKKKFHSSSLSYCFFIKSIKMRIKKTILFLYEFELKLTIDYLNGKHLKNISFTLCIGEAEVEIVARGQRRKKKIVCARF